MSLLKKEIYCGNITACGIKLVLGIAASYQLRMRGGDLVGAYLVTRANKDYPVYIKTPKGMEVEDGYCIQAVGNLYGFPPAEQNFSIVRQVCHGNGICKYANPFEKTFRMIPSLKLPSDISAESLPRQLILSSAIQEDNVNIFYKPLRTCTSTTRTRPTDPRKFVVSKLYLMHSFFQRKYPSLWHYARSSISCLSQVANAGRGSRVCLRAHEHDQDFTQSEFGFDMVHGLRTKMRAKSQQPPRQKTICGDLTKIRYPTLIIEVHNYKEKKELTVPESDSTGLQLG